LEKISPDGLSSFYEIGFSDSNIQRVSLKDRLDAVRGSSGFSSNMKLNSATVNPGGKEILDGKSSPAEVQTVLQSGPENRWSARCWVEVFLNARPHQSITVSLARSGSTS
jgi:hypothetical protein